MDKIKKKIVNYKKLGIEFHAYFTKFSGTIGSYYEDDITACKAALKKYDDVVKSIAVLKNIKSIEDAFVIVHYMNHMDLLINDIQTRFEYFNPGKHRFTSEFSTTYMLETSAIFDKVIVLIDQVRKKNLSYDFESIVYMGAYIMGSVTSESSTNGLNVMNLYEQIRKYYKKYIYSVSLYAYVVQEIVDLLFAGDKENRIMAFKILNMLEGDKNDELMANLNIPKFVGSKNNPAILSFGLIPVSELLSLTDAIQLAFNQTISSDSGGIVEKKIFDELGLANKVGIIVFRKITARPTEYIVKGLVEKSKISSKSGINAYLVDKFRTINSPGDHESYDFKLSKYGMSLDECHHVVIMEELMSGRYRILSPWNSSTYIIQTHEVYDFVEFSKRGFIDKPTRAENYNKVMIGRMVNTMFLDRDVNVRQITEKSQVDEIKFLRNDLYTRLIIHYDHIIESQYHGGKDIKGSKDVIKIINDPSIKDVFVEILIKNYYSFLKKNELMGVAGHEDDGSGHFIFNEVLATFLAQLHVIIRGFVREIFSNSEKYEPAESVYEKTFSMMYAEVKDVIDKVVKESLAKILSDKSNIYQSMIFKTMLLNL